MKMKIFVDNDIYIKSFDDSFDYDKYLSWLNDSSVNQFLETRFVFNTIESIREYTDASLKQGDYFFGIFFNDIYVGNVKLSAVNKIHQRCELGIMIGDKNYWGKGIAPRVIQFLTNYAFTELGLKMVVAGAYALNKSSIKAFEKSNFKVRATIPNYWIFNDLYCDQVILTKEKEIRNYLL